MKKIARLSRQHILLDIIYRCTQHENNDTSRPLTRYYVPHAHAEYSELLRGCGESGFTSVSGSGDAAILRGLARRGFIRRPKDTKIDNPYVFAITEDGRVEIERLEAMGRTD